VKTGMEKQNTLNCHRNPDLNNKAGNMTLLNFKTQYNTVVITQHVTRITDTNIKATEQSRRTGDHKQPMGMQ
jgi:hypothetical protein